MQKTKTKTHYFILQMYFSLWISPNLPVLWDHYLESWNNSDLNSSCEYWCPLWRSLRLWLFPLNNSIFLSFSYWIHQIFHISPLVIDLFSLSCFNPNSCLGYPWSIMYRNQMCERTDIVQYNHQFKIMPTTFLVL